MYAPLIYHWGGTQGLSSSDASDLVQEVLVVVMRTMPEFVYDPQSRFRGWLRTVAVNKARDIHRRNAARPAVAMESEYAPSTTAEADLFEENEYRQYLVQRALRLMQEEFDELSQQVQAFGRER